MNLFLLAYIWLLNELHNCSFLGEETLWLPWEFLFRSNPTNMQNQCRWSFGLCDCFRHCLILTLKRHLPFARTETGNIVEALLHKRRMLCFLGVFSLQSLGHPGGSPPVL